MSAITYSTRLGVPITGAHEFSRVGGGLSGSNIRPDWKVVLQTLVDARLVAAAWVCTVGNNGRASELVAQVGAASDQVCLQSARRWGDLTSYDSRTLHWLGSEADGCMLLMIGDEHQARAALFFLPDTTTCSNRLKLEEVAARIHRPLHATWAKSFPGPTSNSRSAFAFEFLPAEPLADSCPFAILVIDGDRRVYLANSAAKKLLAFSDRLALINDRLSVLHTHDAVRFQVALEDILYRPCGENNAKLVALHSESSPPLLARISRYADRPPGPTACLMITDCAFTPEIEVEAFAEIFHLTPMECRLVSELTKGFSLQKAARTLRLKTETARSYLKRIFQKTGTHRQADLIALLSNAALPRVC